MTRRAAAVIASLAIATLLAVVAALQPSDETTQADGPIIAPPIKALRSEAISGRVIDGRGTPIEKATVHCDTTAVQTDAAGAFACPVWDEGRHTLAAHAAGFADLRATGVGRMAIDLDASPPPKRTGWVMTLRRPVQVSGRVVMGAQPAAGAAIVVRFTSARGLRQDLPSFVWHQRVRTDTQGRFSVTGLPAGRLVVTARKGGVGSSPPIDLAAGQRRAGLLITLRAAASVSVTATSSGGGPLRSIVRLRSVSGAELKGTCDGRGRFRFDGVPAGQWTLVATAPGHYATKPQPLDLRPH
ncbi:MAG: carboxypeptidase regulatory-like domain-containing protein, partial [Myxococcales bacterium]|nr:carboxypeptidase regulatory-like domain-containing protein [Myxococcales bacterium]